MDNLDLVLICQRLDFTLKQANSGLQALVRAMLYVITSELANVTYFFHLQGKPGSNRHVGSTSQSVDHLKFFLILLWENEHTCLTIVSKAMEPHNEGAHKIMSSTALPKVMFIRAPMVSPSSLATLSVA